MKIAIIYSKYAGKFRLILGSNILSGDTAQKEADTPIFDSLVGIEHAGHSVPGDNPDAFEVVVRNFLSSSLEINKENESQAV
jgi:hypothetical protein